jgi:hypothetical protein
MKIIIYIKKINKEIERNGLFERTSECGFGGCELYLQSDTRDCDGK